MAFENEYVIFDGFLDKKLKKFIECEGGTVHLSKPDLDIRTTMVVYNDQLEFKKSPIYLTCKHLEIRCIGKEHFYKKHGDRIGDVEDEITELTELSELSELLAETDIIVPDIDVVQNKRMCYLIKKVLTDFYDDIYIPYFMFKDADWDVTDVLCTNGDSLFYGRHILDRSETDRFFDVYNKYVEMMKPIFDLESVLGLHLENWIKTNRSTYLKKMMTEEKYRIINPLYLTSTYKQFASLYKGEELKAAYQTTLDKIMGPFQVLAQKFHSEFHQLVSLYVCTYPIGSDRKPKKFIHDVLIIIIEFADKLVDLNIYAIHKVIFSIVNYYLPLIFINEYDSKDYDGKKLITI